MFNVNCVSEVIDGDFFGEKWKGGNEDIYGRVIERNIKYDR